MSIQFEPTDNRQRSTDCFHPNLCSQHTNVYQIFQENISTIKLLHWRWSPCVRILMFSLLLINGSWLGQLFCQALGAYSTRNSKRVMSMVPHLRAIVCIRYMFQSVRLLLNHCTILSRNIWPICVMVGWQNKGFICRSKKKGVPNAQS